MRSLVRSADGGQTLSLINVMDSGEWPEGRMGDGILKIYGTAVQEQIIEIESRPTDSSIEAPFG